MTYWKLSSFILNCAVNGRLTDTATRERETLRQPYYTANSTRLCMSDIHVLEYVHIHVNKRHVIKSCD